MKNTFSILLNFILFTGKLNIFMLNTIFMEKITILHTHKHTDTAFYF